MKVVRDLAKIKAKRKPKTDAQLGKQLAKRIGRKIGGKLAGPLGRVVLGGAVAGGIGAIGSAIWEIFSPGELGTGELPPGGGVLKAPAPVIRRPRPYFPSREPMDRRTPEQMPPGSARRERIDQIERQLPPIDVPHSRLPPFDPFDEALKRERIGDPTRPGRPPPAEPIFGPPMPAPPAPKPKKLPRVRRAIGKIQSARSSVKGLEAGSLGVLIAALRKRGGGTTQAPLNVAVVSPVTPPTGLPDLTPSQNPSVSFQTSAFVGGYARTNSSGCSCSPKKRGKGRKCLERGTVYWKSGRNKGKSAGTKCIRFAQLKR